jgi:hypothetical protein
MEPWASNPCKNGGIHRMHTMKVFHATPHDFDFPDYEKIRGNMTGHANGMLGLWVGVESDWIEGFGSTIYEIELQNPNVEELSICQLAAWCRHDHEFHEARRLEYLNRGVDYVRLVEQDGRSDMGILVNFAVIASFQKMPHQADRLRHSMRA